MVPILFKKQKGGGVAGSGVKALKWPIHFVSSVENKVIGVMH